MSGSTTNVDSPLVTNPASNVGEGKAKHSNGEAYRWFTRLWSKKVCILKTLFVVLVIVGVLTAIILATRHPSGQLPPPNHAHFVIRDGERHRFSIIHGITVNGWTIKDSFGEDDIISAADTNGVFTVQKSGLYLLTAQVTFYNKAPHNTASILINGVVWKQQVHSSPLQLNKNGEKEHSFSPCVVSSPRYLEKGDTIAIGIGYRGRRVNALPRNTFFDIAELR